MIRSAVLLIALVVSLAHAADAQGLSPVLRGGAGVDSAGRGVFGGQIGLVDFGSSSSVEFAVALFEARLAEDYVGLLPGPFGNDVPHENHEDTRVRGVGPLASVLIGDGPRGSRGPYLAVGLGLGAFDSVWNVESPTANGLGNARPGGGSMRTEERLLLGGLASLGLGLRVHRRLDVRAQALTLMTPSTDERENAKLLATFMLTAGVGL